MLRRDALQLLRRARVPLPLFAGLLLLIDLVLSAADALCSGETYEELFSSGVSGIFVYMLTGLITILLEMGRVEYCARVRRGEQAEYSDLFWGFSYVFKILCAMFLQALLISLGLWFFFVPGIILSYRYRFWLYNLSDDPSLGVTDLLSRSGWETAGFKMQIFLMDVNFLGVGFLAALPLFLWSLFGPATLPSLLSTLIGTALTYPLLLISFWRTAAEMELRDRILAIKQPTPSSDDPT